MEEDIPLLSSVSGMTEEQNFETGSSRRGETVILFLFTALVITALWSWPMSPAVALRGWWSPLYVVGPTRTAVCEFDIPGIQRHTYRILESLIRSFSRIFEPARHSRAPPLPRPFGGGPWSPRPPWRLRWKFSKASGLCLEKAIAMGKRIKSSAERKSVPSSILDEALQKQPNARTLLIDGWVELNQGLKRQRRHLYLYNDLFIVAKIKRNHLKVKYTIKLMDMWTASYEDEMEKSNTNTMTSFVLGWPTVNYVATFSSEEQKEKWFCLLQRYINLEKEKDSPKIIPIKIFTEGFGNYTYYKTIAVRNSDTAREVITMSLPKLRINGSVRDYQLWVKSEKEAAPYPLIGHEYIYAIKMNHLRDTALLKQESKDGTTTSNLLDPFLMEDVPQKMHCQFILKPRHLPVPRPPSGWDTFRKSIRNWACCQDSNTYIDDLPIPPRAGKTGQLFGIPLENIFEDNNPPKPILEFLRRIPGSLFTSDLYYQWVSVMWEENKEEKINAIQRLLEKLPKANVILIKYLFGVLQNIAKHSFLNIMTPCNLSICIGLSILWPSNSSNSQKEPKFIKEVLMLIQFMIEHAHFIFEDINSLWGEDSVSHRHGENAPGHEDHHQIEMKHLEDTATTSNMLEPFLMEEVAPKMQSPVIQKQSHLAVSQKTRGLNQVALKKRSIKNQLYLRNHFIHPNQLNICQTSPLPGVLILICIPDIFENEDVPNFVLDVRSFFNPNRRPLQENNSRMLSILNYFRQPRAIQDSNVEEYLDYKSLVLIAYALKVFLRNTPNSIFHQISVKTGSLYSIKEI